MTKAREAKARKEGYPGKGLGTNNRGHRLGKVQASNKATPREGVATKVRKANRQVQENNVTFARSIDT